MITMRVFVVVLAVLGSQLAIGQDDSMSRRKFLGVCLGAFLPGSQRNPEVGLTTFSDSFRNGLIKFHGVSESDADAIRKEVNDSIWEQILAALAANPGQETITAVFRHPVKLASGRTVNAVVELEVVVDLNKRQGSQPFVVSITQVPRRSSHRRPGF